MLIVAFCVVGEKSGVVLASLLIFEVARVAYRVVIVSLVCIVGLKVEGGRWVGCVVVMVVMSE